jgi:hypothetical protein
VAVLLRRRVGFGGVSSEGTLAIMSMDGGAPKEVLDNVGEADWSPDGSKLAVTQNSIRFLPDLLSAPPSVHLAMHFPPVTGERYGFILFRWNDSIG